MTILRFVANLSVAVARCARLHTTSNGAFCSAGLTSVIRKWGRAIVTQIQIIIVIDFSQEDGVNLHNFFRKDSFSKQILKQNS
jgi:hypothetical protein